MEFLTEATDVISLASIDCTLPLAELYKLIEWGES